jgi:dipeptidyl aminopeptidase/acylaminoacyl peptidase
VLLAPAFFWLTSRWSKLTEGERGAWQETGKLRVANDWIDTEISYRLVEESSQFPIKQLIDSVARPLLIFHGMADDVVPYSHSVYFVEQSAAASIELRLFKDGDHRLTAYRDVIAESACAFFARFTSFPSTDGRHS